MGETYWMALAEMEGSCGLGSWESNSAVRLAFASSPEGPYERTPGPLLLQPFAHNPTMHVTSNGSLVLAHIGMGVPIRPFFFNCTNGTTPGGRPGRASLALPPQLVLGTAGTPLPPPNFLVLDGGDPAVFDNWRQINSTSSWAENNPGLYFYPDDSVLLIYKVHCACPGNCFCAQFGIATASHYLGPYVDAGLIPVYGEDAYIWRDSLADGGAFHMLFQGGSYAPQYPQYVGHWHTAFSADGLNWTVAADSMVFDGNITINGAPNLLLGRRERHQVLFTTDGEPSHLFNGAQLANATSDNTFTSVQPLKTKSGMR